MQKTNDNHISQGIADKLCGLHNMLDRGTKAFKDSAQSIQNEYTKQTVMSLALESDQYAHELYSQLQSLGLENDMPESADCNALIENIHSVATAQDPDELLAAWNKSESLYEKVYRDILNEYHPYQALRKLISYQLNGLKCGFMKMRLLHQLLYS
ncbi:hypothetical protein ACI6Q2_17745 [Chitinophagaceae bacterium LWZ2-11]